LDDENVSTIKTLAVPGGTGKEGSALAKRWALNGYRVIIGSRSAEKAQAAVAEMNAELGGDYLTGMANEEAAKLADIVVLSVPYDAHQSTLNGIKEHLAGKILVDLTVPLKPPAVRTVFIPEGKAPSLEAQALLGEGVTVIAAFQNVSSEKLKDLDKDVDCDVLICGDDDAAKAEVIELAKAAGMRGIDAGKLANAVAVDALTSVLLYINKKYGVKGAGIRITGIEAE
jgi:8-hydroxy-5-deazaflavin:NADPH oxidoreductase